MKDFYLAIKGLFSGLFDLPIPYGERALGNSLSIMNKVSGLNIQESIREV